MVSGGRSSDPTSLMRLLRQGLILGLLGAALLCADDAASQSLDIRTEVELGTPQACSDFNCAQEATVLGFPPTLSTSGAATLGLQDTEYTPAQWGAVAGLFAGVGIGWWLCQDGRVGHACPILLTVPAGMLIGAGVGWGVGLILD